MESLPLDDFLGVTVPSLFPHTNPILSNLSITRVSGCVHAKYVDGADRSLLVNLLLLETALTPRCSLPLGPVRQSLVLTKVAPLDVAMTVFVLELSAAPPSMRIRIARYHCARS